ncbi:GFA family protein [Nioella aestuarii]|uniref:GFA family protein n=1 Tax=Nioella aestuarii TaxID=1662864 RepID=UPI003D7F2DD3
MSDKGNAGCMCGAIRLRIEGKPVTVMQCHCSDCQKSSGGGAALIALMRRDDVTLLTGSPEGYSVTGASGGDVRRCFCVSCGAPVYSELGKYPSILAVKLGAWDVDPGLAPDCAIWTASAPPWHHIPADIPSFPKARPAA